MKATFAIAVAALAVGVCADNCKTNLNYCGYNLRRRGGYGDILDQVNFMLGRGKEYAPKFEHALFYCAGGRSGVIEHRKDCANGCADGGSGRNDFCVPS
ncbi:hypothetical protein MAPG_04258 [Magnaporthiopsis poae ATCC 64411]|uniref:Uncharacterized protein n=1 Tax=Magnaporthiopsis poae (strain ATCC 64411 / 73-15) TaxID=644358 RepID=A0A0C4DW84_MAGP6|nr:hypothetical protein MAPG_04258 [Magnaporthiopsis poae ATCC 64411]